MKLRDVLPPEFFLRAVTITTLTQGVLRPTYAARLLDVEVTREHRQGRGTDDFMNWPGPHRNVHVWWELENGNAVAWNKGRKGSSFPVISLKRRARGRLRVWGGRVDYRELDGHLYVYTASRQKAVNLIKRAGYQGMTLPILDRRFNNRSPNDVLGLALRRGVWIVREEGNTPEKIV